MACETKEGAMTRRVVSWRAARTAVFEAVASIFKEVAIRFGFGCSLVR